MKFILRTFLLVMMYAAGQNFAWADHCGSPDACPLVNKNCGTEHANEDLSVGLNGNGGWLFYANSDDCSHGTEVVVFGRYYIGTDTHNAAWSSGQKLRSDVDWGASWEDEGSASGSKCSDSININRYPGEHEKLKSKNSAGSTATAYDGVCHSAGGCGVVLPHGGCWGWYCDSGYIFDSRSHSCVEDNQKKDCEDSHGEWKNDKCFCDPNKDLKDKVAGKTCQCNSGSEWKDGKCDFTTETKCKISGGTWTGTVCNCTGEGLTTGADHTKCECDGKEYFAVPGTGVSRDNPLRCSKDYKTLCESSGGEYDAGTDVCICPIAANKEPDPTKHKKVCRCKSGYTWAHPTNHEYACRPESNGGKSHDELECLETFGRWGNGVCECDMAKNMKQRFDKRACECVNDNYDMNYDQKQCVVKNCVNQREKCNKLRDMGLNVTFDTSSCNCACTIKTQYMTYDPEKKQYWCKNLNGGGASVIDDGRSEQDRLNKIIRDVKEHKSKLKSIESGFKTSVWKTAEGNFNGSRLVSDSIAGVVLGTAGGLITSSVIKKNQVKSGFENIQCSVGGQIVADWGDEFQVGRR